MLIAGYSVFITFPALLVCAIHMYVAAGWEVETK